MLSPELAAWMQVIGADDWRDATAEAAAETSRIAADDLRAKVGDRFDALSAFQEHVAREAASGALAGSTTRERLFDGLMQGFDALQDQRAAVLAIWKSRDPGVLVLLAGRAGLHMRRLAIAAGMNVKGLRGQLRLAALSALALKAFSAWRADASPDMSATMAELDRLLDKAERAETEGLSPDLIGLPGLSKLLPFSGRRGGKVLSVDQAPRPSPGLPEG